MRQTVTNLNNRYYIVALMLAGLLLSGCAYFTPAKAPAEVVVIPEQWSTAAVVDDVSLPWLAEFDNPQLSGLVEEALRQNPDLRNLAASVKIAQEQTWIAGSSMWPQLDAGIRASKNKRSSSSGFSLSSPRTTNYGFSLDFLWEIDLWYRLGNSKQAANHEQTATIADLQAARLSLAANIVKTWLDGIVAGQQVQLAKKTIQSFQNALAIIEQGYNRGINSALDVRLARSNLLGAVSREQVYHRARDQAVRSLEFFLGRYPAAQLALPDQLPGINSALSVTIPSTLLQRRPDILAATERFFASDQRLLAARKNILPTIRLTGSGGTSTKNIGEIFNPEFLVWNIASGLTQPLFHAGRLLAERDQAEARVEQAAANYARILLQAFREVETTLAAEQWFNKQEQTLVAATEESTEAERLAENDYVAGLADITTLLESQRRAFDSQNDLLDIRRQRLQNRVNLYLALGGPIQ